MAAFLGSLGLDASRYQLADGSGRAHSNRASAAAYVDFLTALATRWERFETWKPTLAVAGEPDGTLRHRLLGTATAGKVWAKTGNVAGVVTLCGYVQAQSGQTYVFSILLNGGCRRRARPRVSGPSPERAGDVTVRARRWTTACS